MAILIKNIIEFRTNGERRFARWLEKKLPDDILVWYELPIGKDNKHPDFIILDPRRGIIVFEVKDWSVRSIQSATKTHFKIIKKRESEGTLEEYAEDNPNPHIQVFDYAATIADELKRGKNLISSETGKLLFPWGWGAVLTNITRKDFDKHNLGSVLEPSLVICKDEMHEDTSPEAAAFLMQNMVKFRLREPLVNNQLAQIRALLDPQLVIPPRQEQLFNPDQYMPDVVKVMDIQQEQLARSLGLGHRIIHGVAGSGKTMILLYRAQYTAKMLGKPTLILCYNTTLATHLAGVVKSRGLGENIEVYNFHGWCRALLDRHKIELPVKKTEEIGEEYYDSLVRLVIENVENRKISAEQYNAVLIDEGHDFKPEWLHLAVRMLDMKNDILLLLYDDAQSIYGHAKKRGFSFRSAGVNAQGRTTILRINYRNTAEILMFAAEFAQEILKSEDADEDGVPTIQPVGAGRASGIWPQLVKRDSLKEEAAFIAKTLHGEHRAGKAWRDMAIIYRAFPTDKELRSELTALGVPCGAKNGNDPSKDCVRFITMHSSKGLEFPFVIIPAIQQMPFKERTPEEEARLLYVAMTRATERLILTYSNDCDFTDRLKKACEKFDR